MGTLFVAGALALLTTDASAAGEDEVRAVFDQFVKAQNGHDVAAVRELCCSIRRISCGSPAVRRSGGARRPSRGSNLCIRVPGGSRRTCPA